MRLDQTRYECFIDNPERYRITYECNLVPVQRQAGLDIGIAMHKMIEFMDADPSVLDAALRAEDCTEDNIREARRLLPLYKQYKRNHPQYRWITNEQDVEVPIPFSPHSMVMRLENVTQVGVDGVYFVEEYKTAHARTTEYELKQEWKYKAQAGFEILGARQLGYDVQFIKVLTFVKRDPAVMVPEDGLEVYRTQFDLDSLMLTVAQTCDTIEFYRQRYGVENPWPRWYHTKWASYSCKADKCEYAALCGQRSSDWNATDLCEFKEREEHLDIMKSEEAV